MKPKKRVRCEIFSRIVGYYRPVDHWNEGKKEEFRQGRYLSGVDAMAAIGKTLKQEKETT